MAESIGVLAMPILIIVVIASLFLLSKLVRLWLRARASGAPVPLHRIVRMSMNRLNPQPVIDAYSLAVTGGVDATLDDIEHHAMAGGRLQRTVIASVAAKKAEVPFPFAMARAMDLTGRDVVEVVQDLIRAKRDGDRDAAEQLRAEYVHALVNQFGEVTVAVGPPGMIVLDDKRVNAISDGGYIKKGARVRVVAVKDNVAVVRQLSGQ
ncbi:MAG: flotillin-like FloA family protein [Candidatus Hydrogenedentes bacterium]|nr:flotillin-like FloA family protein [Candidatus Hydrogenedentota bacterium]